MPHDKNGNVLKEGDIVTIRCRVKTVHAGDDFCNLILESVEGRKPDHWKECMTLNAAVVEKSEGEMADKNLEAVAAGGQKSVVTPSRRKKSTSGVATVATDGCVNGTCAAP